METVEKLKLRLSEINSGAVTKFYSSWLENVTGLADMIPSINVAGDADLARIGQKLSALTVYNDDELKADEGLRKECIKQLTAILAQIGECYQKAA